MKKIIVLSLLMLLASFVSATCTPPITNYVLTSSFPAAGTTAFASIPAISGCRISLMSLVVNYSGNVTGYNNVAVKVWDNTTCTATSTGTLLWEGYLAINPSQPSDHIVLHGLTYWTIGVASHLQCVQFSSDPSGISLEGLFATAVYQ